MVEVGSYIIFDFKLLPLENISLKNNLLILKKSKNMGTYNKGILGAFSGKVGPVVGASWRGKDVLRSLPRKGTRVASETQLLQRLKFSTATEFLNSIQPIVSRYYGSDNTDKTRRNQAMSHLMKEAMQYTAPDYGFIYNKIQISKGDLLGIQTPTVVAGATTSLEFTWTDNSGQGEANATDKLVIAVYEPTTKTTVYSLNAAQRSIGFVNFILPAYISALTAEIWVTFVSDDDRLYATSVYLGSVVLT
jgi:hypothetical protein